MVSLDQRASIDANKSSRSASLTSVHPFTEDARSISRDSLLRPLAVLSLAIIFSDFLGGFSASITPYPFSNAIGLTGTPIPLIHVCPMFAFRAGPAITCSTRSHQLKGMSSESGAYANIPHTSSKILRWKGWSLRNTSSGFSSTLIVCVNAPSV